MIKGIILTLEEAKLFKEAMEEVTSFRKLAKDIDTYVAHIQRFLGCKCAMPPNMLMRAYEKLGEPITLSFIPEYVANPPDRKIISEDPNIQIDKSWAELYISYSNLLREIYINSEIQNRVKILSDLEKIIIQNKA